MTANKMLRRHALVWLSRPPQPDVTGNSFAVDQWHADGNPFVVCRQRGGSDHLSLGFCLPSPGQRPRRIAVLARRDQIVRVALPPSLDEVAAFQPDPNGAQLSGVEHASRLLFSFQAGSRDGRPTSQNRHKLAPFQPAPFAHLAEAAAKDGLDIRVFGSWMWQTLTGGSYVNAASDLDVLVDVADAAGAGRAADFLQRKAEECPFKLDGELSFPGLGEIHWREYLNDGPMILVKSIVAVRMIRREELWK
jgi:phosphoribosyl-dephospho-CoA transferase